MIYTLTLNPAIDKIIEINNFELGKTNICNNTYEYLGGKGINVAKVVSNMQVPVTALVIAGAENANIFEQNLSQVNINHYFFICQGKIRTNYKIKDYNNNQETEINEPGFAIDYNILEELQFWIHNNIMKNDYLIMSGSLPIGCNDDIYAQIAKYCYDHNIPFVIDCTGIRLLKTLPYKPLLIKPNIDELNMIFGTDYRFHETTKIVELAKRLITQGAQYVLVSGGKDGSILVSEQEIIKADGLTGELINSTGAGDAMVGAFISKYVTTKNALQAFIYANAAGAATAFSKDLAGFEKINSLVKNIIINNL